MDTMRNKVQIVKSDSRDRFYFFFTLGNTGHITMCYSSTMLRNIFWTVIIVTGTDAQTTEAVTKRPLECVSVEPEGCLLGLPSTNSEYINALSLVQLTTGRTLEKILTDQATKGQITLGDNIYIVNRSPSYPFLKHSLAKIETAQLSKYDTDRFSIFDKDLTTEFLEYLKKSNLEDKPDVVLALEIVYQLRVLHDIMYPTTFIYYMYVANALVILTLAGKLLKKIYNRQLTRRNQEQAAAMRNQRLLLREEMRNSCACGTHPAIGE